MSRRTRRMLSDCGVIAVFLAAVAIEAGTCLVRLLLRGRPGSGGAAEGTPDAETTDRTGPSPAGAALPLDADAIADDVEAALRDLRERAA